MQLNQIKTNYSQVRFINRVRSFCEYANEKCSVQKFNLNNYECFILNTSYAEGIQKAVVVIIDNDEVSLGHIAISTASKLTFDTQYFNNYRSPEHKWFLEGISRGSSWKWFVKRISVGSTFLSQYTLLNRLRIDFEKYLKSYKLCNESYIQDFDTGFYRDPENISGFLVISN